MTWEELKPWLGAVCFAGAVVLVARQENAKDDEAGADL